MTELLSKKVLLLDCQTTGMHPNKGALLQIGWSIFSPGCNNPTIETWTLKLPEHLSIPSKIKRMLHLTEVVLLDAREPQWIFEQLQNTLKSLGPNPFVIAHYAQFEQSFLKQFYRQHTNSEELNFKLLCSQKIAKRVLPQIPSHNLKALSGYFQGANLPKNDISSHVLMTHQVWEQLLPKLIHEGLKSYLNLSDWLTQKRTQKTNHYEYRIERLQRLQLSNQPGIYRMLAQDKTVLYVGKATCLKSRVNSYFRGIKNRDRRKLEMLAQVWDIETQICETPLEAALLESDEIKQWDPPYNLLLKSAQRTLIFYNHQFNAYSTLKDSIYFNGPFKPYDALATLFELINALTQGLGITYRDAILSPQELQEAWANFCVLYLNNSVEVPSMRQGLFFAYQILRNFEQQHGKGVFQSWWAQEKKNSNEDELPLELKIAHKIARIFLRAAEEKRKMRTLWRLYHSELVIVQTNKKLFLCNGEISTETCFNHSPRNTTKPFTLSHYDRLSILISALKLKQIQFSQSTL